MRAIYLENGVCVRFAGPDDGTWEQLLDVIDKQYPDMETVRAFEAQLIRDERKRSGHAII